MKSTIKVIIGTVTTLAVTLTGVGIASAVAPSLPSEQQSLINANFVKAATWAKFDKQIGSCHIEVQLSGKNYYIFTTGKLKSTLYPVIPTQVMNAVTLMNANCQG